MEIFTEPKIVCIDDFALKKRHRYGTVMVNIETHKIVDMIESREQADVAKWLSKYPNIQTVSRDGSSVYAAAIRQSHPKATQVSDRFHLLQNLTNYAKESLYNVISPNVRIPAEEGAASIGGGYWDRAEFHGADLPERKHSAATERKRTLVGEVRSLAALGLSLADIVKEAGISRNTVRKYLNADFDPSSAHYGDSKPSPLKPYTKTIDSMLQKRCAFREIEEAIRADGYGGAASTIRMYATRQRKIIREINAQALGKTEKIQRKLLTKLLYKPIEKVKGITESQVQRVVVAYPTVGILYDIVNSFREVLSKNDADELDAWIESARRHNISEINSFINGISSDIDAVKNAIRYEYNNGLAEGKINKIKVVKRVMYGRCSFSLLRNKILLREA